MKDQVEVYFHSQQPYVHVKEEDIVRYDSGRLAFPNTQFDPVKATCCTTSTTSNTPWLTKRASTAS